MEVVLLFTKDLFQIACFKSAPNYPFCGFVFVLRQRTFALNHSGRLLLRVAISAHTPSLGSEDCPVIGSTVRNKGQKQKRRGWVFRNVEG